MTVTVAPPVGPLEGINLYGLLGLAAFYVVITIIGIWAGCRKRKKESDSKEVLVAGRSIGYVLGSITLTASWVGAGSVNGTTEIVAAPGYGLIWCQAPFVYAVSLMLGGIFYAKKMRAAGYVTMLDPLSERLGSRMGGLLFIPALVAETFWIGSILSALGSTFQLVLSLDATVSVLIATCIAVVYTMIGGLYSVAYTHVLQLVLIPTGLWLTFPFALNHPSVSDIGSTMNGWLGVDTYDVMWTGNYVDSVLLLLFGGIPWQIYFQVVLASRTPDVAVVVSVVAGIGCFLCAIPAVMLGAVAYSTSWNETMWPGAVPLDDYTLALPMVMQYLTPNWVCFIGLGAVSAVVMSSADSSILGASSMFARNVWKLVFRPKASEREVVWVMRVAVLFVGALGAILGITVKSIYVLYALSSDLVYVVLFPQLTMVVYNKTTNTYGSVIAYVVGLTLRILGGEPMLGLPAVIVYPYYDEVSGTQFFPFKTLSMMTSFFLLVSVSYLTKSLFTGGRLDLKYDIFKCYWKPEKPQCELREDAMPSRSDLRYVTRETIMHGPMY